MLAFDFIASSGMNDASVRDKASHSMSIPLTLSNQTSRSSHAARSHESDREFTEILNDLFCNFTKPFKLRSNDSRFLSFLRLAMSNPAYLEQTRALTGKAALNAMSAIQRVSDLPLGLACLYSLCFKVA